MTSSLGLGLSTAMQAQEPHYSDALFSVGLIADCQYHKDPGEGVRKYAASPAKLQQCVDHFNTLPLEYVVHLGDFIDRDFESFQVVVPIYQQLTMPQYHVLGNHDFSVADSLKNQVQATLGLTSRYYDLARKGWRFVILDGNDISLNAHPEGDPQYLASLAYHQQAGNPPKWNGAIGEAQLAWLRGVLEGADRAGENVAVYCHFPVFPADSIHNLWNAEEIVAVLDDHSCVKAYINGHNHSGNYAKKDGIHYFNLKGMVDTDKTSYAIMHFYDDRLVVQGYGREQGRTMMIE